ncbi:MAG TPA: hypothetical protein VHA14_08455 [Bryobacteraceae bacterium]|nr:hypothetical protein [Bryobacteraceae bacterium]
MKTTFGRLSRFAVAQEKLAAAAAPAALPMKVLLLIPLLLGNF